MKNNEISQASWHTPVIPATLETEAGGSLVQGRHGQLSEIPSQNRI